MISTIYAYSTCCTTILENIFNVNEVNYLFFFQTFVKNNVHTFIHELSKKKSQG